MFLTAVIPTINRITLSRSVYSILNQDFNLAEYEVIVVNDTGQSLPESEWQHADRVRIITTQRRERSVARNTGAAIARGEYLYFLDDDDIMMPGALQAFWELAQKSHSAWLFGSYQTVDNDGNLIEEFNPQLFGNISAYLIAGEGIPFQASLLKSEKFFAAGQFDPDFTATQDRDLGRRLSLMVEVVKTPAVITQIRVGQIKSSTNWARAPVFDRLGREKAFNQQGSFSRLWNSASGSMYLHGRVSRAYLASTVWNFNQKNLLTAVNRLVTLGFFSIPFILSSEFWKGARTRIPLLGKNKRDQDPTGNGLIPIAILFVAVSICFSIIFPKLNKKKHQGY